jgi:hypothetical protein
MLLPSPAGGCSGRFGCGYGLLQRYGHNPPFATQVFGTPQCAFVKTRRNLRRIDPGAFQFAAQFLFVQPIVAFAEQSGDAENIRFQRFHFVLRHVLLFSEAAASLSFAFIRGFPTKRIQPVGCDSRFLSAWNLCLATQTITGVDTNLPDEAPNESSGGRELSEAYMVRTDSSLPLAKSLHTRTKASQIIVTR